MSGNSFGKLFKITTWGESHGPALGVIIDGCPAMLDLKEEELQPVEEVKPAPPSPKPAEAFKAKPEIKPPMQQPPAPPKAPTIPTPPAAPKSVTPISGKIEVKIKEAAVGEMPELGAVPKEKHEEILKLFPKSKEKSVI